MKNSIRVRGLIKRFGKKKILKGIDLDIPSGEFLSILGPSGSGKTTFLKILAGILEEDGGSIEFPENKGAPVLVFQDFQLFPYMSVFNNIAFGLQARKLSRKVIDEKVRLMSAKLGILNRIEAYPAQLSGGEKQRCALARALVLNPEILLLDEPFANLDKNLKAETAQLLKKIQKDFKLTLISVSHDQEEAMMLSDTIALLIEGELKEFGAAEKLYRQPRTLEGAQFFGQLNCIHTSMHNYFQLNEKENVFCRPEGLILKNNVEGAAMVTNRTFNGKVYRYSVNLDDQVLELDSMEEHYKTGNKVDLVLKEYFCLP